MLVAVGSLCPTLAFANGLIRVAVADGILSAEVSGGPIRVTDLRDGAGLNGARSQVRAVLKNGGVEVEGRRFSAVRLRPEGSQGLKVNGREYPGILEVLRNGDGLAVVNELPLEEYLVGVLKAEVSDGWPVEMLKAQAVVARTYAAYHRQLNAGKPFHLVASVAHQQYVGRVAPSSRMWLAVKETEGEMLHWEGQLFPAFFHTESGGHTEDPRVVFAAANMPALKPVRDQFSGGSPHQHWSLDLALPALVGLLKKGGVSIGSVVRLEVLERGASLRVVRLAVHGTRGSAVLRGADFRKLVGNDSLKSTFFAVAVDKKYAHFAGRGYGHGIGLSQWGARAMAEQGYRYRQILEFYYPGSTFSTLP
ncbi:MAG: SpoIID/LytB domain-containing protein [Candidatus Rokubacteria bacterium]|nr:SpoIID/LytB domain-containing protein [Candidatus Rokubacteria bacterium]